MTRIENKNPTTRSLQKKTYENLNVSLLKSGIYDSGTWHTLPISLEVIS